MKSKYEIARDRVKKKVEFRQHLGTYVVIIAFLFVINIWTSPGYLWAIKPFWPALGWGIGIIFHGLDAYGSNLRHWYESKQEELIEQEMRRMQRKEGRDYDNDDGELELRELRKEPGYRDDDFV